MSGDPNILYRDLRAGEDYKRGLTSKNKDASITPLGHVSRTLKDTTFISASRSIKPAAHFAISAKERAAREPGTILEIDKRKLVGDNFDLTDEDVFNNMGLNLNKHGAFNALKAQEVLHKGDVPRKSICLVIKVKPNISQEERKKIKALKDPNYFTKQFFYNHTDEGSHKKGYPLGYSFRRTPLNHPSKMPEEGYEASSITVPWAGNSSITIPAIKRNLQESSSPLYREGKISPFAKGGKVVAAKKSKQKARFKKPISTREKLEKMLSGK